MLSQGRQLNSETRHLCIPLHPTTQRLIVIQPVQCVPKMVLLLQSHRRWMHTHSLCVRTVREHTNLRPVWVANHSSHPFTKLPRRLNDRPIPPDRTGMAQTFNMVLGRLGDIHRPDNASGA